MVINYHCIKLLINFIITSYDTNSIIISTATLLNILNVQMFTENFRSHDWISRQSKHQKATHVREKRQAI